MAEDKGLTRRKPTDVLRRFTGARSLPLRRFLVVEDSMRPTLNPGDGLLAWAWSRPRPGQLRVFRDPTKTSRWLIKRVGEVYVNGAGVVFEARSDNREAPGVVDSRHFGPVSAAGTYRVAWIARGAVTPPRAR